MKTRFHPFSPCALSKSPTSPKRQDFHFSTSVVSFRKKAATAPKEYLMRERMRYARKILQTEGLRVGEVADLMQFETVFQFSNQYKNVHGHSPMKDRPAG
ncbi:MAG: helix-turn-helix domain-containing protein [Verrucomicrobiales bacterium]|nr:helix-turn-helix domain-containing protein [Verrucomicrobiales bacterium]